MRRPMRDHVRRFRFMLICCALCVLASACRRAQTGKTPVREAPSTQHIVLDGHTAERTEFERIRALYLAGRDLSDARVQTLSTDAYGSGRLSFAMKPHNCVDIVVESANSTETSLFAGVFRRVDHVGQPQADPPSKAAVAWVRRHANAWILPHICPDHGGRFSLVIRGDASTHLEVHFYPHAADAADRRLFGGAHAALPGFWGDGPVQHGTLAAGKRMTLPVAVRADRCIAIVGVATGEMKDLDVRLLNRRGDVLALDVATSRLSIAGPYCPHENTVLRVEFRAYTGQGGFRWQRWASDRKIGLLLRDARDASPDGTLSQSTLQSIHKAVKAASKR